MKFWLYKALLALLRALIYLKRGLFWVGRQLLSLLSKVYELYTDTVGFWLYKLWYSLNRRLTKYKIPLDSRAIELFGKRGTLQFVLFCVVLVLMYPNSRLQSRDYNSIPGRSTLLYELVGPGDLDYSLDELIVEESLLTHDLGAQTPAWKEGALVIDSPQQVGKPAARGPQDITSVSAGGSALTKPTILPGSALPVTPDAPVQAGSRTQIVEYTVQPGDVIGNIASQFGVDINTILWANNLTFRSYIRPGDILKILPTSGVLHTVARGDTLGGIARTYDADMADIIAFNKLQKDGSDIVIGEELIIPGGEKPQPTPTLVQRTSNVITPKLSTIAAPPPSVEAPAGSGFLWPTAARTITQYSNWRHVALDIAGPIGTATYATKEGTVIKSQCGWNGGYGCYIIIDHGGGVQSLYGHHSELLVAVGDEVTQGQTIGLMGSTGRSSGPHVHFEIRVNGAQQNPLRYVR